MAHRIDIELTSSRDDGTWTWRKAGAKQPKGALDGSLLWDGAAVGDVAKAEVENLLDGIEVVSVTAPKQKAGRNDLLEMISRPLRDDELVSTERVSKRARSGDDDRGRGRGRRRDGGGGRGRGDGENRGRGRGDGEGRGRRDDRPRRPRVPEMPQRPKPKRLRPRRTFRDAVLNEMPQEHRPIAEQWLRGRMPAVRAAIEEQNKAAKENNTPEIEAKPVIAIAESVGPKLDTAEWKDRATAALADLATLDLRDLRSVVAASDSNARDDESREMAEQLKTGLNDRTESDHNDWVADLTQALEIGRTVRALRLSSRPVKAGAPLPPEIAGKMAEAASLALAADTPADRYATVVEAIAFSPIRGVVTPAGRPAEATPELLDAVRRVADRVPSIASLFDIDPAEAKKARRERKRNRPERRPKKKPAAAKPEQGGADAPAEETPVAEAETTEAETTEAPAVEAEAPVTEEAAAEVEAPAEEAPAADAPAEEAPAADAPAEEAPVAEAEAPAEEPAAEAEAPAEEAPAPEAAEADAAPADAEAADGEADES